MHIRKFDELLRLKLSEFDNPRPFVCNGNPLECEVFIVGFNAATEMKSGFYNFWSESFGFDKNRWFTSYINERMEKPLKQGKTRRNKISNTRQRIEWILSSLKDIKCLETNIYSIATMKSSELSENEMISSTFEFLLKTVKPKVILVHGKDAKLFLEKMTELTFINETFNTIELNGSISQIYPISHLSRGWSKLACSDLGDTLLNQVKCTTKTVVEPTISTN